MEYVTITFLSGRNPISGVLRYSVTSDTRTVTLEWNDKGINHVSQIPRQLIKNIIYNR